MKTDIQKTITITLDQEEAEWLRGVMQNPLHDEHPDEESARDREMRSRFFFAVDQ